MSQGQSGTDETAAKGSVHLSIADRIVIPLVTAVLAFLASFVAADIANSGAAENQRAQIDEQRRKDDRDRRYDIYVAYIDAVIAFTPPLQAAIKCLRERDDFRSCVSGLSAAADPRAKLQTSFNRVVMYGSERVHAAARELYIAMLPFDDEPIPGRSTSQPREIDVGVPELPTSVGVDSPSAESIEVQYNNAYAGFLTAVCVELPNIPRASC